MINDQLSITINDHDQLVSQHQNAQCQITINVVCGWIGEPLMFVASADNSEYDHIIVANSYVSSYQCYSIRDIIDCIFTKIKLRDDFDSETIERLHQICDDNVDIINQYDYYIKYRTRYIQTYCVKTSDDVVIGGKYVDSDNCDVLITISCDQTTITDHRRIVTIRYDIPYTIDQVLDVVRRIDGVITDNSLIDKSLIDVEWYGCIISGFGRLINNCSCK